MFKEERKSKQKGIIKPQKVVKSQTKIPNLNNQKDNAIQDGKENLSKVTNLLILYPT